LDKKKVPKESGEISRRKFLKDAGLIVGGAAIGSTVLLAACGEGEVTTETVTTTVTETASKFICPYDDQEFTSLSALQSHVESAHPAEVVEVPKAMGYIAQVSIDESVCAGCGTCELVCAAVHEGSVGPSLRRIWLEKEPVELIHHLATCQQCDYPECYFICPLKDEVLCIDSVTGARYINNPDKCLGVGCKFCIDACPFDPPRINFDSENNVVVKCDLCKDRADGPACIEFCNAIALTLQERR